MATLLQGAPAHIGLGLPPRKLSTFLSAIADALALYRQMRRGIPLSDRDLVREGMTRMQAEFVARHVRRSSDW